MYKAILQCKDSIKVVCNGTVLIIFLLCNLLYFNFLDDSTKEILVS